MRAAVRLYAKRASCVIIEQEISDFESLEVPRDAKRGGFFFAPMPPQRLAIKPEGQRNWKWWNATGPLRLQNGWFIKRDKKLFEVMELTDWSQAGVYVYEVAEAPR